MNSLFSKISSLFLTFLVLISTFSVSIDKHFCGENLVDVSYFGNAKKCTERVAHDVCEDAISTCDDTTKMSENSCCSNETDYINGQDELKTDFEKLELDTQQFLFTFVVSKYFIRNIAAQQLTVPVYYSPPKLLIDKQILFETFII